MEKFIKGDKVICIPGYTNAYGDNYGGAGYKENKILTVNSDDGNIVWADNNEHGVYQYALKKYIENYEIF